MATLTWKTSDNAGGAGGWGGDSHPAQEPQALTDREADRSSDWLDKAGVEDHNFVYANGQLHVSDHFEHDDLLSHAGVPGDHTGPMAMGHVHVDRGKATWSIEANVSAQALSRVLKEYGEQVGWVWGGMTDMQGEPIGTGSEFAPVKSYYLSTQDGQLVMSRTSNSSSRSALYISGKKAFLYNPMPEHWDGIVEFARDQGLTSYRMAGNDNVLKRHEDLEIDNNYTPEWKAEDDHFTFQDPPDERQPGGVFKCPNCAQIFPTWGIYMRHRKLEEGPDKEPNQDGKFPTMDLDATFPPNTSPMAQEPGIHTGAQPPAPKDMLTAPLPFIYDIDNDQVIVGQPGMRHSDIPGKFTPGGMVEGTYEPGGKVMIRSLTNMPYTVRHMLELWYYSHPELEIRSVNLVDDEGKNTKLAAPQENQDIGAYINAMLAADPTAWAANKALRDAGGQVFVVGGAVRDALLGKEPKDIDLMVTGLPADSVHDVLKELPGRVDLTGKDFGVFRYNHKGGEVEIALPRRERSTGSGHQDFNVQADHTMTPEEDLFRRDFTANAMAVNTANGTLLDPFHGSDDLKNGVLRTLNTKSLSDDPLRTVRALVAMSKHGLAPDEPTKDQMSENAHLIKHLPAERVRAELDKLFMGKDPASAIQMAQDTGILEHIFPEVSRTVGHSQNNPHHEQELYDHLISVLQRAKERKPFDGDFALAALLHDIGKKDSHWTECRDCGWSAHGPYDECHNCGSTNTSGHFYAKAPGIGADHETVGAEQAGALMKRLRYPNARIDRVTGLIQHHMFPAFTSEKGARKYMNRVGDHADDLLDLRWADQGGKSIYPTDPSISIDNHAQLLQNVREQKAPTNQSQLAINGRNLIALGVPQGPQVGEILRQLTDAVIENPQLNSVEALEGLVRGMM